jgi:hypothetical protein
MILHFQPKSVFVRLMRNKLLISPLKSRPHDIALHAGVKRSAAERHPGFPPHQNAHAPEDFP